MEPPECLKGLPELTSLVFQAAGQSPTANIRLEEIARRQKVRFGSRISDGLLASILMILWHYGDKKNDL